MNTQTYVGIAISVILVVLLILYLTGVFSSGRRGFSSKQAADLKAKYPNLAHHEYEYPSGSTCSNPPKTLEVIKIESSAPVYNWAEDTAWVQGKYNFVDTNEYTYWKHETKPSIIYLYYDDGTAVYRSSENSDNANPASNTYGTGYSSMFPDNNPEYIYEKNKNQEENLYYKFKIRPC